jgi:hypothetical protein
MQERGDFVRCRLFRGEELRRIQLQAAVSGEGYGFVIGRASTRYYGRKIEGQSKVTRSKDRRIAEKIDATRKSSREIENVIAAGAEGR